MRKFIKKSIAVTSALAMALSIAPLAGAADGETDIENAKGNVTVTDQFEGYVDKKVFNVVLPTVSSITFTLDPQGLLNIADSGKYTQKTGAVYFSNTGDSYTDTSDAIEVTNQSSYGVNANIKLTVTNTETSGITVVDSADALADATTPSIYLGLKKDDGDAAALKAGETTDTKKLAAVAEDQEGGATGTGYYIDATASGDSPLGKKTYAYKLGTGFTASADQKASFKLTGKCDSTSDWSKVSSATMNNFTVAVAWDITEAATEKTNAYVTLYNNAFWCCSGSQNTDVFDTSAALSNVKVNGVAITGATINEQGYVIITWAQCEAAGGDALGVSSTTPDKTKKWVVDYTVDGTDYTTTYEQ